MSEILEASITSGPVERQAVSLREKIRALAPNIGHASLGKKLLRPQTYTSAVAVARDMPKWHRINQHLAEYTEHNGGFFFVQVGANDGVGTDSVRRHVTGHGWQGLLVEPVPHTFEALRRNYESQTGLQFANVAITESKGTATMFAGVAIPGVDQNPMGPMSSFKRDVIERNAWIVDDVDAFIVPTEVETTTLPALLDDHGVTQLDGLFVDTEGYDKIVLDQLDYERYRPQFIMYEHIHLSRSDQVELAASIAGQGYDLMTLRQDTFAERA